MTKFENLKKYWFFSLLIGLLICLFFVINFFGDADKVAKKTNKQKDQISEQLPSYRHPLTGEPLAVEISRPQIFGVMIENFVEAWPLFGLENAFLVIEAPVEAKIPRLIAFFDANQIVEKIGPVRSARPYYLDWAMGLDALYVHVGGSPEALQLIRNSALFDLNQFWNDQYFWRATDRSAPHNVFTSSELLNKVLVNQEEAPKIDYALWFFKDDKPIENFSDTNLVLSENSLLYQIEWQYNPEANDYFRWQNGREMKSADGNFIKANNVAVVYTAISVTDSTGRREIETIGEGDALVLQDGRKISAVWKKESADERLRFYAEDGKEIFWNAGVTWIEVVSTKDK